MTDAYESYVACQEGECANEYRQLAEWLRELKEIKEQQSEDAKIRAEIDKQEKWLLQAGYNAYNVDIAFSSIKLVLAKSEVEE